MADPVKIIVSVRPVFIMEYPFLSRAAAEVWVSGIMKDGLIYNSHAVPAIERIFLPHQIESITIENDSTEKGAEK